MLSTVFNKTEYNKKEYKYASILVFQPQALADIFFQCGFMFLILSLVVYIDS